MLNAHEELRSRLTTWMVSWCNRQVSKGWGKLCKCSQRGAHGAVLWVSVPRLERDLCPSVANGVRWHQGPIESRCRGLVHFWSAGRWQTAGWSPFLPCLLCSRLLDDEGWDLQGVQARAQTLPLRVFHHRLIHSHIGQSVVHAGIGLETQALFCSACAATSGHVIQQESVIRQRIRRTAADCGTSTPGRCNGQKEWNWMTKPAL